MKIIGKYANGDVALEGVANKYRVRVEDSTVTVDCLELYRVVGRGAVVNLKARRSPVPDLVADNIRQAVRLAETV